MSEEDDDTGYFVAVMSNHYVRRVFPDSVVWVPRSHWDTGDNVRFAFVVQKFAFVPDYHVTFLGYDYDADDEGNDVMSTHKTLAEAMSILNVLLANGGMYA
jgi:hypothetical protein